jgi:hypothetical protein
MKKKFILAPLVGGLLYVALTGYITGPGANGAGDRTGATAATAGCGEGTSCHASVATPGTTVAIQLYDATGTTPVTAGYTGGTNYIIRITGANTGGTSLPKFGFQVSCVKTGTTTNEGALSAIAGTHSGVYGASLINIIEQSEPIAATSGTGGSGTTYVVNIPWTAPPAGTSGVTVYAVLNAVNNDLAADAQDLWNNNSLAVPEAVVTGVAAITGTTAICAGATTTLSDATTGGAWSSSHTTVATIGATGTVTGVAAGTTVISYNAGTAGVATTIVTVLTVPAAPDAITGSVIICVDKTTPLANGTAAGAWSSTNTALATISTAGVVAGVAIGTDIISYTVTNTCGSKSATHTMSVRAAGSCALDAGSIAGAPVNGFSVYPNPNDGTFTVKIIADDNEMANIAVTNIIGARVKEYNTLTNQELNIALGCAPGIYFITATTAHGRFAQKMLVD